MNQVLSSKDIRELKDQVNINLQKKDIKAAREAASRMLEAFPLDPEANYLYAVVCLEDFRISDAFEYANIAVKLADRDPNARFFRGQIQYKMGMYESALLDFDYVINLSAEFGAKALEYKVSCLAALGKYADAMRFYDTTLSIDHSLSHRKPRLREWLKNLAGQKSSFLSKLLAPAGDLLIDAEDAIACQELWYAEYALKKIIEGTGDEDKKNNAKLLQLKILFNQFKLLPAKALLKELHPLLPGNPVLIEIAVKMEEIETRSTTQEEIIEEVPLKPEPVEHPLPSPPDPATKPEPKGVIELSPESKRESKAEEPKKEKASVSTPASAGKRTDFELNKGVKFRGYYARTFDLTEQLNSGRKYFVHQFNAPAQGFIAVELIVKNPYFNSKDVAVDGQALWYINEKQIGESNFELQIESEWSNVAVVQSWGTGNPGFWTPGQGRVEIFLNNELICTKWFILGFSVIYDLEHYDINEIEEMEESQASQGADGELTVEKVLADLDGFIGLGTVKQTMRDFVDYLNFIQERKKLGLKTKEGLSVNSVFLGNPGTGKTTVARVIGDVFKAMNLLPKGHIIEVDRATLVGQYVGETAQKTEKVIEDAMGGILFIDEAYTLVKKGGTGQDFGQEAIDTLLKRMEDKAGEFVTIVAGYPNEMNDFLESNPGMKSRFTQFFQFEDYTPDEMIQIFEMMAKKEDYSLSQQAKDILNKEFTNLYRNRDKTFGNGRLVRNVYDDAKMRLSKRYLKLPPGMRTEEALTTFEPEDIAAVFKKDEAKQFDVGINEEKLKESLDKLNGLMGLTIVKKEINELVKIARFYFERGENLQNKFSDHIIFLGNPGTGKTTVARIFSDIYSALGILPKGHLVETDRQNLVSSYVGQTAAKTTEVINQSIGGTLFVDEAYTLVKAGDNSGSDFGKEAIDTLLKRMEDDRGKFIVIAAGYTEDMEKFLDSNAGLKSRFTKFILFEDYTPDELVSIAVNIFKSKQLTMTPETMAKLKVYFNEKYRQRDKTFSNARMVRNIAEAAIKRQLLRMVEVPKESITDEMSHTITVEDIEELAPVAAKKQVRVEGDAKLLEQHLKELESLTGLGEVKKATEKLISSLKIAKLREERGLKVIKKNLHVVFMGNPGTGKTTVARLLSKIYKELGLLEKGHLIEVDRSSLVAGYQGQTAQKTDDVIKQALGGTLFIDEAYTLSRGGNDFGQEAIDTLLKRMEDYSDKLVVIVAGYPNEMRNFLDSNPGLQSRFTNFFMFEDYTPEEMLDITKVLSEKSGYKLDESAMEHLNHVFKEIYDSRDQNFGNARTVRNVLYKAIGNQEERILTLSNLSDDDLVKITIEDVQNLAL
ncbi:MAG: AAA family ATPase [Ignavibacteria bacterium]|nr:AAA family ATPase [Ignavibacteria bacterium]